MKAYHVSPSILQSGNAVPSSTSFFNALDARRKVVEQLFESVRPEHLPKRENAIFVFEDETQARKWASRKQRHLFSVEVEPNCIMLRADWCWLSLVEQYLNKNDQQTALTEAKNYWAGKATECPWWELLSASATIVEEISIPEPERNRLRLEAHGLRDLRD
jgi:hypothetical protein